MSGAWVVARRELGAYFDSVVAYVYVIGFLVLTHSIFMNEFFLVGTVSMTPYFELLPLLLAFFLPAITMRQWAEELDLRTFELLMTLPMRPVQVLLGKLAAVTALTALALLGSFPIVVMLAALGEPDLGRIAAGYLGALLLGLLFLSIGLFMSGLTRDQIVAFVLASLACLVLVLTGNDRVVAVLDGLWPALDPGTFLYESISVRPHYDAFVRGVVDLAAVLYFLLMSALFLGMNLITLQRHKQ